MYRLSQTSCERLSTCHNDLILIVHESIGLSAVDFGVAEGHRSLERQKILFAKGKSKVKKSKHNHTPSLAVDLYAYVDDKASWNTEHLCYIAGVVTSVADRLHKEGKIKHRVRWGGNWDNDGEIVNDQSFIDLPHYELI